MEEQKYYTTREISKILKISPVTITRKLQAGEIKGVRIGGRAGWRVEESALQEYLGQIKSPATSGEIAPSREIEEQLEAVRQLKELHAQIRAKRDSKQESAIEELYRLRERTLNE